MISHSFSVYHNKSSISIRLDKPLFRINKYFLNLSTKIKKPCISFKKKLQHWTSFWKS